MASTRSSPVRSPCSRIFATTTARRRTIRTSPKQLAALGDIYVDDAFSSAHRAHASVEAITHLLPSYAGLLMMAEIRALDRALEHPARPVMAIVGGAKVSTKIRGPDQSRRAHGPARAWRRHGHDLPLRPRRGDRRVALRARCGADRQGDHGARQAARLRDRAAASTSWWRRSSRPAPSGRSATSATSRTTQMILDMGPKSVADLKRRFAEMKTLCCGTARSAPSRSSLSATAPSS